MNAHKLLQSLFVAQTLDDGEQAAELFTHLSESPSHARQFDALAMTARQLEGTDQASGAMSQMEHSFHELHFMHALDEQLASEVVADTPNVAENVIMVDFFRPKLTGQIVALAAMMLATLGVGILLRPADPGAPQPVPDEFQPRGVALTTPPEGPVPTLEVFCLTRNASGEVQIQGKQDAAFGVVSCPRDAEVQFAYTNPGNTYRYAALFGISERGETLWYGPSPTLPGARPVRRTMEPRSLGDSIRLEVNHSKGTIKTYAIFSDSPIDHVMLMNMVKRQPPGKLYTHPPAPRDLPRGAALIELTFDVIEVP